LTDQRIKHVTAALGSRIELWDAVLPGLGLRVASPSTRNEGGSKTWFVRYRIHGAQRRLKLGTYPTLGLSEAREAARYVFTELGKGIDAAEVRDKPQNSTFSEAAEEFVTRYAKQNNRRWKETDRILKRYIPPEWGRRPIADISRRDILALLDRMMDRGTPVMAKQTHATVRKLFYWAESRGIIDASPCVRIPAPAHATERDRVLTDDEIRAVWVACHDLGWPFGPLIRLLLLTGQRKGEVATMRWRDLDLDAARWTIPRESTKGDRAHEVPLSRQVMQIIRALPKVDDTIVFTTNTKVPVAGFSNAKRRLDGICKVENWHLHDLRRTAASGMARLGVAPHVVEKVLNHKTGTISGVAAIYNRHGYYEEKRVALTCWANRVLQLSDP
jgi:integrase